MAFTLTEGVRGTRDVRAIDSDCNCCDSLQITVRRSLSFPDSQPVSDPPFPPSFCYPRRSYSLRYACPSLAASGNIMLRISAVCKRSIGGVTYHPVDPVRATAADNDITLSVSECTQSSQCGYIVRFLR